MSATPNGMNTKSVVRGLELRGDTAIHGLQTAIPSGVTQLTVGTVTYPLPDLIKYAQEALQPWKDSRQARATIRQNSLNRSANRAKLQGFLADLKFALCGILGRQNEALTQFGFKPQQNRKPLTPEQKVLRAAKAKLTRQMRHTMGSKQKANLGKSEAPAIAISPTGQVTVAPTNNGATASAAEPTNGATAPAAAPAAGTGTGAAEPAIGTAAPAAAPGAPGNAGNKTA